MTLSNTRPDDLPSGVLRDLCRTMVLIRRFEEKIVEVYGAQEMKTPVHLCIGQEAIAAGVCHHLEPWDYLLTTHRGHGHCLAKGMSPRSLYAEFYGRIDGCCGGKGGSMHPAAPELGVLGTTAIVGGSVPLAAGAALASSLRGDGRIAVAFFGDGAADEGAFHEALNFAALKQLPVVFVCENNFYATASPQSARHAQPNIARRALAYGIPGVQLDGNDVLVVHQEAGRAVRRARDGSGPALIEARTYRWKGHVGPETDWQRGVRPREELEHWMAWCPIERFTRRLLERGVLTAGDLREMIAEIDGQLDVALASARASAFPAPEALRLDVFCPGRL
jgi:pyruvate dehydrogenase E1 component alpha subunit